MLLQSPPRCIPNNTRHVIATQPCTCMVYGGLARRARREMLGAVQSMIRCRRVVVDCRSWKSNHCRRRCVVRWPARFGWCVGTHFHRLRQQLQRSFVRSFAFSDLLWALLRVRFVDVIVFAFLSRVVYGRCGRSFVSVLLRSCLGVVGVGVGVGVGVLLC